MYYIIYLIYVLYYIFDYVLYYIFDISVYLMTDPRPKRAFIRSFCAAVLTRTAPSSAHAAMALYGTCVYIHLYIYI